MEGLIAKYEKLKEQYEEEMNDNTFSDSSFRDEGRAKYVLVGKFIEDLKQLEGTN